MDKKKIPTYHTKSLYLSAFLLYRNIPLLHVKRDASRKVEFIFEDCSPEREQLVQSFFNNSAEVKVQGFCNALRNIKTIIYEG